MLQLPSTVSEQNSRDVFNQSFEKLKTFFDINWETDHPRLILLNTRAEIDELKGYQTEPWEVGWAEGATTVYILRQEAIGIESAYPMTQAEYEALIEHELCHCFWDYITHGARDYAVWLNEGLAIYISGQLAYQKRVTNFAQFLDNVYVQDGYAEAGAFVQLLLKLRPKSILLELMQFIATRPSATGLAAQFQKLYGIELSYAALNEALISSGLN